MIYIVSALFTHIFIACVRTIRCCQQFDMWSFWLGWRYAHDISCLWDMAKRTATHGRGAPARILFSVAARHAAALKFCQSSQYGAHAPAYLKARCCSVRHAAAAPLLKRLAAGYYMLAYARGILFSPCRATYASAPRRMAYAALNIACMLYNACTAAAGWAYSIRYMRKTNALYHAYHLRERTRDGLSSNYWMILNTCINDKYTR